MMYSQKKIFLSVMIKNMTTFINLLGVLYGTGKRNLNPPKKPSLTLYIEFLDIGILNKFLKNKIYLNLMNH